MGSVVSYVDFVYMENPDGECLTNMKVCAGETVTGTKNRRRYPSEDTCRKYGDP